MNTRPIENLDELIQAFSNESDYEKRKKIFYENESIIESSRPTLKKVSQLLFFLPTEDKFKKLCAMIPWHRIKGDSDELKQFVSSLSENHFMQLACDLMRDGVLCRPSDLVMAMHQLTSTDNINNLLSEYLNTVYTNRNHWHNWHIRSALTEASPEDLIALISVWPERLPDICNCLSYHGIPNRPVDVLAVMSQLPSLERGCMMYSICENFSNFREIPIKDFCSLLNDCPTIHLQKTLLIEMIQHNVIRSADRLQYVINSLVNPVRRKSVLVGLEEFASSSGCKTPFVQKFINRTGSFDEEKFKDYKEMSRRLKDSSSKHSDESNTSLDSSHDSNEKGK